MASILIAIAAGAVLVLAVIVIAAMALGSLVEEDTEKTRAKAAAQMAVTDGEEVA